MDKYIDGLGIREYCSFDPTLARGQIIILVMYLKFLIRVVMLHLVLVLEGRYDNMITEYIDDGNIYPAIGIIIGLSSIYEILKNRSISRCFSICFCKSSKDAVFAFVCCISIKLRNSCCCVVHCCNVVFIVS